MSSSVALLFRLSFAVRGGLNEDTGRRSGTGNVVITATTPRGNVTSLPVFVAP
jgi:hypothetical protein